MGKGILDTCQVSVLGDCVDISSRTIEGAIQFGHTKLQLSVKLRKISQLVFAYADAEPKIQILLYISPLKKKSTFLLLPNFLQSICFTCIIRKTEVKTLKGGSRHKFPEFFYVGHFPSNIPPWSKKFPGPIYLYILLFIKDLFHQKSIRWKMLFNNDM